MFSKFMSHSSTSGSGRDQVVCADSGMGEAASSRTDTVAGSDSFLVSGLDFGSMVNWDWFGCNGFEILTDGEGGSTMSEYFYIHAKSPLMTISGKACSYRSSGQGGPDFLSPVCSP